MREIQQHSHDLQRVEKRTNSTLNGHTLVYQCVECDYWEASWESQSQTTFNQYQ